MSLIGDIVGTLTGAGSSSASVSSTVNLHSTIGGTDKPVYVKLDPVAVTENIGGTDTPLELKPITLSEHIGGTGTPLDVGIGGTDKPLELKPVTLNENIDLKPLAVDTCQTLKFAPLPDTSVCNPYRHRIAMSMWGVEVLTLAFHGETEQQIRSPRSALRTRRTEHGRPRSAEPQVIGRPRGISVRVIDGDG